MRWQDCLATVLIVLSAGLQSSLSSTSHFAGLVNFPMIMVALLSTYPRIHVITLMVVLTLTRIAIGTEEIPVTLFRSSVATYLSIKAGLRLINQGWLLAVVTVTSSIIIDLVAAVIAHPKYVLNITMTDILVAVVFNASITLICAVPLEIYYRKQHLFGF